MPTADFTIKQGDTSPSLDVQLIVDGSPIDLSDAVVLFRMQHQRSDITRRGLCEITDASSGRFAYIWNDGDTDAVGEYNAEFLIDYDQPESAAEFEGDETFPSDGFIRIDVTETISD